MFKAYTDEEYCEDLIKHDKWTFADCLEYPEIMKHYVQSTIKRGDERGYPIIKGSVKVPTLDDYYNCFEQRSFRRSATAWHKELIFLRGAPLGAAVKWIKDNGYYPVKCRAKDMPTNLDWDNFPEVS